VIILACAPASAFRIRHAKPKRTNETHGVERSAPTKVALGAAPGELVAEAANSTGALAPKRSQGPSAEFWLTDALVDLLADIGSLFNSLFEALMDTQIASKIVDYIIDETCDTGTPCPVTYAECVSPYSLPGHRAVSRCSDIMSDEGTGLTCAPWNKNVFGYKPCWDPIYGNDAGIERECEERCPSSLEWGDAVHLPEICNLYKDTFCPLLQSESSAAMREALKDLAVKALHPDAWIPEDASTGRRSFNGWMALILKTLAGVGIAFPSTRDEEIYRGLFPELYRYKDCLGGNNNRHDSCKHHVEYDENPALKSEGAYQLTVSIRGYNYQNSCRGENTNMANFGVAGLGIDTSNTANFCRQSDKTTTGHDSKCVGIAGNVPSSRPREPVGNLEQSSCNGVEWPTMAKVYDADLGVCVGKDAYAPLKVWKHEGLLSDTQVGLFMTEEGNKVKLTLNNRGSEVPDIAALPTALTSEAFDASALWRQIPETIKDWLFTDFMIYPSDDSICDNRNVKLHTGFQNAYKTFKNYTRTQNPNGQTYLDEVAAIIRAKMAAGKEVELYISGHSLGGGMAVLMAYDIWCHRNQFDATHREINSVLGFSKDKRNGRATGPFLVTFGEAPVLWGKRSAAGFAAAVPANVHMRVNTCGQETTASGTFYSGDLVGLSMDYSADDDQGYRRRAGTADFQCAWVSKTFFARASSTGLDSRSMTEPGTVISPGSVDLATSSSCAGALLVGGVSLFDSAIFCHFLDRYMEGMVNDRGVENNFAVANSEPRKSMFHEYNRPKAETRATCQNLGTYSYSGETYRDIPQVLAEYDLRNVVSDVLNIPVGEIFDRLASRTSASGSVLGDIQAKYESLTSIATGLYGILM